jgi:outer membrane protease
MTNKALWAEKLRSAITAADRGPSENDFTGAPVLKYWRPHVSRHGAPILWGIASGHPRLKGGWITTSQLVAIDVDQGWARTASRWYALGGPFSDYEAMIAEGFGIDEAPSGFVQMDVPGYRPLDDMSLLDQLLAAWRDRILQDDMGQI